MLTSDSEINGHTIEKVAMFIKSSVFLHGWFGWHGRQWVIKIS